MPGAPPLAVGSGRIPSNQLPLALAILVFMTLASCSEDEDKEPVVETFRGTYGFKHPATVGASKTDSIILTVTDNRNYRFDNFDDLGDNETEICGSSGVVVHFGSNTSEFKPSSIEYGNCDTLRIPRGTFDADFQTHGDTIWFDRVSGDTTFSIRLLR